MQLNWYRKEFEFQNWWVFQRVLLPESTPKQPWNQMRTQHEKISRHDPKQDEKVIKQSSTIINYYINQFGVTENDHLKNTQGNWNQQAVIVLYRAPHHVPKARVPLAKIIIVKIDYTWRWRWALSWTGFATSGHYPDLSLPYERFGQGHRQSQRCMWRTSLAWCGCEHHSSEVDPEALKHS